MLQLLSLNNDSTLHTATKMATFSISSSNMTSADSLEEQWR